ncbi:proline racemase family protein [Mesorhizobium sp. LHD-90]|uniref:proline racemase family protein n=1 Tax=Mesorhizobium sp. LHD-90 TaxID=3071414 RepID=UPI0027E0A682|nr:proline racemase family protein [Mesorhizobium sp. LHD-90]MDQ6433602.1 proline racemase family protein [Mesorhizobium sp. LHD-90]
MHTGGEPVRIVTRGYPPIPGATILEKRRFARENLDHLRKLLIFEPRGHYDMYGVIPVEPDLPGADMAVLFIHNEGYSTMCGHAVIALGRYAVDTGIVPAKAPFTEVAIQCPCGLVRARVEVAKRGENFVTGAVSFESVPSFAFALDEKVDVPGLGKLTLDIGYGGAFYAIIPASAVGLDVRSSPVAALVEAADRITKATAAAIPLEHPDDPDLAFLYGTILTDGRDAFSDELTRNVCVFAEREVDRSPTGSGVSARIAVQVAKGQVAVSQARQFESITGAVFSGKALRAEPCGRFNALQVAVGGRAHYSGRSTFTHEDGDELGKGFLLR